MTAHRALLLLLPVTLLACRADLCEDEAASFQLDVRVGTSERARVTELRVALQVDGQRRMRTFSIAAELADGHTSLAVALDPAPTAETELVVTVVAMGASGAVLAESSAGQRITPDGCNRLELALLAPTADGGATSDAGPDDAGPTPDVDFGTEGPVLDAGAADVAPGDGPPADATPGDALPTDALVTDAVPADATPPDAGPRPDATPPDVGPAEFAYEPTNFDPATLQPATALVIDCGRVVVFDSTTLTFTGTCGTAPVALAINQANGPSAAVIPVTRLVIAPGSGLDVIGTRPVILAVFGEATVEGPVRAIAEHDRPGAGSNPTGGCTTSAGGGSGGRGGGGGGGFGGAGERGGRGGDGRGGGDGGDPTRNIEALSPLRGGCPGGTSDPATSGAGGGGGGAIQISAATSLVVRAPVRATGGGGRGGPSRSAGGGGGSGGAIFLEAQTLTVQQAAVLDARGGGGGGGGENGAAAGTDGNDGAEPTTAGGTPGGGSGGAGGAGADGMAPAGPGERGTSAGSGSGGGGGGGGGGAGRVRLRGVGACQSSGVTLPPAGC